MRPALVLSILLCGASMSEAQSTFVSASLLGEIGRFSVAEVEPNPILPTVDAKVDGEAIGFGLAIERAVGERWGVSLEFTKAGAISGEDSYELPFTIAIFPPLPPIEIRRTFEHERYAVNPMAWYAQPVGDRLELAFLAGVSFLHTDFTQSQTATVPALALIRPDIIVPRTTISEYSVEPIVGVDARIRFTDRLAIVPGVRLQSASAGGRPGWLIRPGVAVRFGF
jgi:hypothetical protein